MTKTENKENSAESPDSEDKQKLLSNSFQNAAFLMVVQIFSKIMTFSLNFMVARIVTKEVYGYASIQLQLFNTLILWYTKEAVRKTV